MSEQPAGNQRRRERSPAYPGIDLETALSRARAFYASEGRHAAPVTATLADWGYKSKTGPALRTLGAMKHFGLMVDQGSLENRLMRLSPLALKILLDERPVSPERQQAIREAALAPRIHRELWDKYGGSLPSDANLEHELVVNRSFIRSAAQELIKELKATMAFAKPAGGAYDEGTADDVEEDSAMQEGSSSAAARSGDSVQSSAVLQYRFPLPIGMAQISFFGLGRPSRQAWEALEKYISIAKGFSSDAPVVNPNAGDEPEAEQ